jgi:hypothetical protein
MGSKTATLGPHALRCIRYFSLNPERHLDLLGYVRTGRQVRESPRIREDSPESAYTVTIEVRAGLIAAQPQALDRREDEGVDDGAGQGDAASDQ